MSTDTKIKTLIFNKLTQEQYNNADRVPTEFYLTPDTSIDSSEKGAANGVASLDTNGKVPSAQIPTATTSTLGGVKPDGNTITVTKDGTISAAISGEGVATKAELQDKVNKAGDTMSGQLKMSGENEVRFGTDDNFYYINKTVGGYLEIYGNNRKGLFLNADETHAPHYFDGTEGYRLLTTADLPGNAGGVGFPDLSAPVSYSANVAFTAPASGWVWTQGYFSAAGGQTVTGTLNGKSFTIGYNASSTYNFDSPLWFPVAKGDVWLCNRSGFFYPMR